MKNYSNFIVIFSLLLSSCSSIDSPSLVERIPSATDKSCSDLVKAFFAADDSAISQRIIKERIGLDIGVEELTALNRDFTLSEFLNNTDTFRSILLFSQNDKQTRDTLLEEFRAQLNGHATDEKNDLWKKFSHHKKIVDEKKSKIPIKEKSLIYEGLYYSCKTQIKRTPSPADLKAAKRLTYALTAGSLGSSIVTYSAVNWNEEKNSKWFNELYFSLGVTTFFSFVGGKLVLANPNLHPWKGKMPLTFLNNALSDIAVSGVYAYLFKTDDKDLSTKIEELKKDPEAQAKIQELVKIAEENNLFEKHLKKNEDFFKDKKNHMDDPNLTADDIDFDASRELLIAALAEQEYIENSGIIATGYRSVDRFSYHRLYNLLSVPTNIGLTILMYDQMCMTENPKKGFMKAVGTYLGVSLLFDALYFKGRKELINQ